MKIFLTVCLKFICFFTGWILCVLLVRVESDRAVWWRFFAELIPLVAILAVSFLFWLWEKRTLDFHLRNRPIQMMGIGLITGMAWIGCATGMLVLLDVLHFHGSHPVDLIGVWLCSVFMNAMMQELLVRGYLYQMVKQKYNVVTATIATTALFTLLHGGAFEAGVIPLLNIVTTSLMLTVILEVMQSLWVPIMMHFVWNAVGGVVLHSVLLADDYPYFFHTTLEGNPLLSGNAYKMEGSILVFFLNLCMILGCYLIHKKTSKSKHETI